MKEQSSTRRPLWIALGATAFVVLVIFLVFVYQTQESHREGIVMPGGLGLETVTGETSQGDGQPFLTVAPDNVASVIGTMVRPTAYRQQSTLVLYHGSESTQFQVTTWRNGELQKTVISSDGLEQKHLLTDGEKVWIWYEGDSQSALFTLTEGITFENLVAMPSYETVAQLPPAQITKGEFVADETGSYLQVDAVDLPQEMAYSIDTETQLLVGARGWLDGIQTMAYWQEGLDILSPQDQLFEAQWTLPEGLGLLNN